MQVKQTWDELARVVDDLRYIRDPLPETHYGGPPPPRFELEREDEANYAVLYVRTYAPNHYRPGLMRLTTHEAVVPVATYNYQTWMRWVFERLRTIETHELCETFLVVDHEACPHCGAHDDPDGDHSCPCPKQDGECDHNSPWLMRPYAPHHGHGEDPYVVWHTREDRAEQVAKYPGQN